jgi:putative aminopeptidase FrvX
MLDTHTLLELLACHSTPGDEGEVRAVLERVWRQAGLKPVRLGDYAVTASAGRPSRKPVLLITAHMDSPGFAVDRLRIPKGRPGAVGLTPIGHPAFSPQRVPGILKTRSGKTPVTLRKHRLPGGSFDYHAEPVASTSSLPDDLTHGDRACFASDPECSGADICAPFLDNRLGCWILAELAPRLADWRSPWRIVLGATACEEAGGFGATVLARQVQPDLVIVLDATYDAPDQQVRLGRGPVLTLTDASVLLSPARRDQIQSLLSTAGIPLQTEVYNYSGTDARAFPQQGLPCPVLPLLLATTGNHSPHETANLRDVEALMDALRRLAVCRI